MNAQYEEKVLDARDLANPKKRAKALRTLALELRELVTCYGAAVPDIERPVSERAAALEERALYYERGGT